MKKTHVNYMGFSFIVEGDWIPYRKATLEQPEEGDCFDEWDILLMNESIWELLSKKAKEDIIEMAEENIRSEDI
ncbi:MAG: hypothetical protein DRP58_12520 [Spirochaetes bacterium]|nr:MAG: hypothetical protein DRP58_12520 [Spirochaetota bacterium]